MYSVFAVDDEPIVLEGIRSKIDWEGSGFTFAGEATDGEIALSMIHEIKPDILITDIKMPFMDGLQLAEAIKKTQPWIKIIILSGHDEFDYAKKAISIGIEDYLLKPFTPDELLTSLNKTASQIDKERKQLSDISRLREELKSNETLIKKEFLNNLVHGSADTNSVMQKCGELGINIISRYYKVLISRIESRTGNNQNQQEACSLLNSYSSAINEAVSSLTLDTAPVNESSSAATPNCSLIFSAADVAPLTIESRRVFNALCSASVISEPPAELASIALLHIS